MAVAATRQSGPCAATRHARDRGDATPASRPAHAAGYHRPTPPMPGARSQACGAAAGVDRGKVACQRELRLLCVLVRRRPTAPYPGIWWPLRGLGPRHMVAPSCAAGAAATHGATARERHQIFQPVPQSTAVNAPGPRAGALNSPTSMSTVMRRKGSRATAKAPQASRQRVRNRRGEGGAPNDKGADRERMTMVGTPTKERAERGEQCSARDTIGRRNMRLFCPRFRPLTLVINHTFVL